MCRWLETAVLWGSKRPDAYARCLPSAGVRPAVRAVALPVPVVQRTRSAVQW